MTTPVPTPKLLKQFLDDLDDVRLKEFQWHLWQIDIEGSRPILRSKLENATREETVDKLVEVFGEDGAVKRTVDTFSRMNLNDLASKLIQAKENQSLEQREEEPETSSAREKPREVDPTVLEDLSCSMCLNLFTDPVVLQCGHSFCQTCIHKDWETNIVRECSLCKQFIPEADPPINFSLKSLCENYRGRSRALLNKEEKTRQAALRETRETEALRWRALKKPQIISKAQINVSKKNWKKTKQTSVVAEPKTASSSLFVSDHLCDNSSDDDAASSPVSSSRRKESSLDDFGDEAKQGLNITPISEKVDVRDSSHRSAYKPQVCPGNPERSTSHQQNLQKSPKRRRVEEEYEDGKVSVHDPDSNTSILTHEGTSTQSPVSHCGDEAKREISREIIEMFLSSEDEDEDEDEDEELIPKVEKRSAKEILSYIQRMRDQYRE